MERKMFDKAGAKVFHNARELRHRLTESEEFLWIKLKEFFPKYKFRRQHPISSFIADFYCHRLKLVIELDGSIHQLPEIKARDEHKQKYLESTGITVLRFTNDDAVNQFEKVALAINSYITATEKL